MRSDLVGAAASGGFARVAPPSERRAAVLLNANAKQVNARVRADLARVVPREDLFFSRTADEAQRIAQAVVARGYRTVFTGGGDGTFVGWMNRILDACRRTRAPAPRFGVLALGTGNAVAHLVGTRSGTAARALDSWRDGRAPGTRRLEVLSCDGRRTPFAGIGVDAALVNDYRWLKERLAGTAAGSLATGITGYFLAGMLRSAPRAALERRPPYCEVVNAGGPAHRLDASGRPVGPPVLTGELLYAGPCMVAAASTVPFYGFGMRAFPFASDRPGSMQVRLLTTMAVPTVLWNLPRLWSGSLAHPALLDFHAERVSVTFERPMPLQVAGDAEGWRDRVDLAMAEEVVDLVDFRRPALLN
jgi:diacylglycerol kinase family enzyme